jgi:hypothetical protein
MLSTFHSPDSLHSLVFCQMPIVITNLGIIHSPQSLYNHHTIIVGLNSSPGVPFRHKYTEVSLPNIRLRVCVWIRLQNYIVLSLFIRQSMVHFPMVALYIRSLTPYIHQEGIRSVVCLNHHDVHNKQIQSSSILRCLIKHSFDYIPVI